MKINRLFVITLLMIFMIGSFNCSKDCETTNTICSEVPPTNELCQAFFTRWFYNKNDNKCEQIGYSGCTQKGFDTEQECEECECK